MYAYVSSQELFNRRHPVIPSEEFRCLIGVFLGSQFPSEEVFGCLG